MSLKKGDEATSTDLWTWKSTRSDDRRTISASSISEYFGGEVVFKVGLARPSDLVSSTGSDSSEKCGAACKGVQVLEAVQLHKWL